MPVAVGAAIASAVVADFVAVAVGSAIIGQIAGAVAGMIAGQVLRSAFGGGEEDSTPEGQITASDRTVTVRQAVSPWQTVYGETRVAGTITYMESTDGNYTLRLVITFAGHECESVEAVYFDDEEIPLDINGDATGRLASYAHVESNLGDGDYQPFPSLQSVSAGLWTDAHRQSGRTKIYAALSYNPDLYVSGLPNITVKLRGKKVYDPRTDTTAWSTNPALIVADYICDTAIGLGADYATEIDEDLLIAAANICDETVTLADGSTEARYTCNGIVLASMAPKDAIETLLTSMAGTATLIGGRWRIYAGAYRVPTVTLTESDFRGPVKVQTRLSRRDNFNAVKGIFTSPDNFWQATDFPPVTNATYEAEDSNERVWQDIRLPYTDSATMAQRIAKIALERARQPMTVVCPLKLSSYSVIPPDTVMLTLDRFGWSSKVFEVVEAILAPDTDSAGAPVLGVDLVLRETVSTVWTWTAAEEGEFDPAPNSNLPSPFGASPSGAPIVTEEIYETTGSAGVKARAVLTTMGADALAVAYLWELKASGDSTYTVLPQSRDATVRVDDLAPGLYDFRVRTQNSLGVRTDYSPVTRAEIRGLTAAPGDVASFSVIASAGFALASWTQHTDLDVRIGGRIIIRHSPLTTGATWSNGVRIGDFPGGDVQGLVPLITGTYMARALDSSDKISEATSTFVLTEGMVTGLSTVGSLTEHPTFSGTKTSCVVTGSDLTLSGSTLWDSLPGFIDDFADIDNAGGQSTSGSYEFGPLDLSTVATRRFEADVGVSAVNNTDNIDSRLSNIDDWESIDGDAVNDCEAVLYIALTDDNPVGSPTATWSSWRPFMVGDFTCRAAKFRLDLSAGSAEHNIRVNTLAVLVKA